MKKSRTDSTSMKMNIMPSIENCLINEIKIGKNSQIILSPKHQITRLPDIKIKNRNNQIMTTNDKKFSSSINNPFEINYTDQSVEFNEL